MAAEKLTDIELESVRLLDAKPRTISKEITVNQIQVDDIRTAIGPLHIVVLGDRSKPAILTVHDIGLNSTSCFQSFFNYPDMQPILKHFCVYHVNVLGQHEGALPLPEGLGFTERDPSTVYAYPTMDELSDMLIPVLEEYRIKRFIGFGVGAGANIISRFALTHPDKVEGLVLINCNAAQASWTEWAYQKWNAWYLKSGQMTAGIHEYLLWHWFGKKTLDENHDLVAVYNEYIRSLNPTNLGLFVDSYIRRTDLGIARAADMQSVKNFKCHVMLITGDHSPHVSDTVDMNARLDPANSTWIKFDCGGMVLEETPSKVCESFRLYLQGLGYIPALRTPSAPGGSSVSSAASTSGTTNKPSSDPVC